MAKGGGGSPERLATVKWGSEQLGTSMRTDDSASRYARSGQTSRFATQNSFEQTVLIHHTTQLRRWKGKNHGAPWARGLIQNPPVRRCGALKERVNANAK